MALIIDMHSHILPGVDDGAQTIEETRAMLQIAYNEGIRAIIATPHHHPSRGHASKSELEKALKITREEAKKIDPGFRIYLGTEIYYSSDVAEQLKNEKILTMNKRKCVLVEFSPIDTFAHIRQGIQSLQMAGYLVIVAHVERYLYLLEDREHCYELADMGAYLQVNASSILGKTGWKVKSFVKFLLREGLVSFVGTDAHGPTERAPLMAKAVVKVRKKYGEAYCEEIFGGNAMRLVGRE